MASPAFLRSQDCRSFAAAGHLTLPALFTLAECDELLAHLTALPPHKAGSRCLLEEPWCREAAAEIRSRLAHRLEHNSDFPTELTAARAVQCIYFHKSPEANWLVAWHQDRSIPVAARVDSPALTGWSEKDGIPFVLAPDELLARMFAVRLHLDDSGPHNGPLRVIPGSHTRGTLTAAEITTARATTAELACPVSRGGVLLVRPLLLHASSKSTAPTPRRVFHFLFGPSTLPHGLAWRQVGETARNSVN